MHLLAKLSLANRALIALVTITVAVFGGISLTSLKQELAPSIQFPQVAIITAYPGATPEVVSQDVSVLIEQAVAGVADLEGTGSTSSTGSSIVTADFAYSVNLAQAEQRVQQAINRIGSQLPADVEPQVLTGSLDDLPIVQLAISGSDPDLLERLQVTAVPTLEDLDGVRQVSIAGAPEQRIEVVPDPAALAEAGLTEQAVTDALDQNGVLLPGGTITEDGRSLAVQTGARLGSVDDITALPLIGADLAVGDVASVSLQDAPATALSRVDGEDALTIAITKSPDANTVEVSNLVAEALPGIADALDGATITTVFDQAPYIEQSIETLAVEGLLGLVFAIIVILVFLLSVRSTIVTAISIPTSVLITFIGMQGLGYSLNILTLGALTIAIGRVVDDSIVVIENIKRHLVAGADRAASILTAVKEVSGAITASTVTTVVVFLPLAFVSDITGELFRPFALTTSLALLASLLVALTIVPVLAYWFLRAPKGHAHAATVEEAPGRLQRGYLPILRGTLRRPVVTLLAAVVVLGGTVAAVPFMNTNFLGDSGQNTLTVSQQLEPGTSLDAASDAASDVEEALAGVAGVATVQVTIGGGSSIAAAFGAGGGADTVQYSVTTDEDADQTALQDDVRDAVDGLPGEITIGSSSGFGGSSDLAVEITAPTDAELREASDQVLDAVSGLDAVLQASSNLGAAQPYLAVEVDREAAAQLGLSEVAVGGLIGQSLLPREVGSVEIDEQTVAITLVDDAPPATAEELRGLEVLPGVPLSDVASVDETTGPTSVTTVGGARTATVTATPDGADLGTATTQVQEALDGLDLPAGASASLGGVAADQADAFSQLGLAVLVAILIVYIVMVATFRSLLQPLLLLVSVPFAATGAVLLQIATGIPLGVASLVGVLMLVGIVVTNAIVLIDLVNQYRSRGLPVGEALIEGATRRLRPILMTALATIFALTPMALGITGHGGFISQPLAVVVIGGLVSSTALTLVVLPVLYSLVEGSRERRAARRAEREAAAV